MEKELPLGWRVLNTRFYSNDLDKEVSIKDWFVAMLDNLWEQGEGFNGKRPLGNSGWEGDPAPALIDEGLLKGDYDKHTERRRDGSEYSYYEKVNYNHPQYNLLIKEAIASL